MIFILILGEFAFQHNKTGYMTSKIMIQYMKFFRKTLDERGNDATVVYFFDRHASHMDLELAKECRENRIVTIGLYPNSTRIIQPLDVGLFGAIKKSYKSEVVRWSREHPDEQYSVCDIASIVKIVNERVATTDTLKNSFRKCGIYPWCADQIDFTRCLGFNVLPEATINPFISPTAPVNDVQLELEELKRKIIELEGKFCTSPSLPVPNPPRRKGGRKVTAYPSVFSGSEYIGMRELEEKKKNDALAGVQRRREEREAKKNQELSSTTRSQKKVIIPKSSKNAVPSTSSKKQRTTKENTNPIDDLFDEEKLKQLKNFVATSMVRQQQREKRKEELADFEIKNCIDMPNAELSRSVKDFAPTIMKLYMSTSSRNKRFNPVLLTTGNILTEPQIDFLLNEIENQRPSSERGSKEDVLTEIVLPELIMHLFCKKFDCNIEQALDMLNVQEEYTMLNLEHNGDNLPKKTKKVLTSSNRQTTKRTAFVNAKGVLKKIKLE